MPLTTSAALQNAYDDTNQVILRTISFTAENYFNFYFIDGYAARQLNDDNGVTRTFTPAALEIGFSPREASLRQAMQFTLPIAEKEFAAFRDLFNEVQKERFTIAATYREYLEGDLNPAYPGLVLTVRTLAYTASKLTIEAAFTNITDAAFPARTYNTKDFSALTYYGR